MIKKKFHKYCILIFIFYFSITKTEELQNLLQENPNLYKTGAAFVIDASKNHDESNTLIKTNNQTRNWLFIVYIAADNDLFTFARYNILQLAQGANSNVYIVAQLNEPGKNKPSKRYLIDKNKAILLNKENATKFDSGNPQTLIDFCNFCLENFPAKNNMLILSDHGSGIIDREGIRLINPAEFFVLNPSTLMLELDRSICFLDFIERSYYEYKRQICNNPRGICYDDTHQTFLTNQKFEQALKSICKNGFKFSIIGLDACLMEMVEIANLVEQYANILVTSQEVELGPGWNYDKLLKPLATQDMDYTSFAKHIVKAYEDTYATITNDYTLSAIDLKSINTLEKNINTVSDLLIECLNNQVNNSTRTVINECKKYISFEEPSYIDITSFYINLKNNMHKIELKDNLTKPKELLLQDIENGLKILENVIIENVTGSNIKYAKGLSIYFPDHSIHNSYLKTNFAINNNWVKFLKQYIN